MTSPQFPHDDDTGSPHLREREDEPPAEIQDARIEARLRAEALAHLEGAIVALSDAAGHLARLPDMPADEEVYLRQLRRMVDEWTKQLEHLESEVKAVGR